MPQDTPASQEKKRSTQSAGIPSGSTTHKVHRWLSPRYCFLPLRLFTGTTCLFQCDWGTAGRKFSVNTSFWCQTGVPTKQKRFKKNLSFHLKTQVPQRAFLSFSGTSGLNYFHVWRKMLLLVGRSHYPAGVHTIQSALSHSSWELLVTVSSCLDHSYSHESPQPDQGPKRYWISYNTQQINERLNDRNQVSSSSVPSLLEWERVIVYVLIICWMIP